METKTSNTTTRRALQLDLDKYQSRLDDPNETDGDKAVLIKALWEIVVAFVDLGYRVEALDAESCGQFENPVAKSMGPSQTAVKSPDTQITKGAAS